MKPRPRRRFWFELATAGICSILFVVTLFWNDWIEIIFRVDPDEGRGALEWLIVGVVSSSPSFPPSSRVASGIGPRSPPAEPGYEGIRYGR